MDAGTEADLALALPASLLGREGGGTLKLEQRVARLFDELREAVFRYLICLNVNATEADEIIQETFLRLYQHLHAGRPTNNLRGWLFRVAHNLAINQRKGRKYVTSPSTEQWTEWERTRRDAAPNPEETLLQKEKMMRLSAGVCTLSAQQKQCLYLRAEGFRYREIAEILGVTVSTIAESLRRAISKLGGFQ